MTGRFFLFSFMTILVIMQNIKQNNAKHSAQKDRKNG